MAKSSSAGGVKKVPVPAVDPGKIPFTADGIGGELVSLLSEGLYSNPLDAIREYIQNGIDAHAKKVSLKYTGRSLFIRDDGSGMTKEQLVGARRFAVSEKNIAENIGFRGIGIYSAFHLCDTMRIRTKISGFDLHTATFNFAEMRKVLGAERGSAKPKRTPLVDLLTEYVRFEDSEYANEDPFTVVELLGIAPIYAGMLSSRDDLERYVLDTIPVHFPKNYAYGDEINARIHAHWDEYHPISVVLQYPGVNDHLVEKIMPPHLERPTYADVKDVAGKAVAFIWGCRNSEAAMIGSSDAESQYRSVQGFAYKVKGMTVGSRRDSFDAFSQGALYNWWTGEIHVLNNKVIPNASRDGFEYSPAERDMRIAVNESLRSDFEVPSSTFQVVRRARLNLAQSESVVERITNLAAKGILTPTQLGELVNAQKAAETVSRNLKKLPAKDPDAAVVRSAALLLVDRVKKALRQAEARPPAVDDSEEVDEKQSRPKRRASSTSAPLPAVQETLFTPEPEQRVGQLLAMAGINDEKVAAHVLRILIEALDETLSPSSPEYRSIIANVQSRLGDDGLI